MTMSTADGRPGGISSGEAEAPTPADSLDLTFRRNDPEGPWRYFRRCSKLRAAGGGSLLLLLLLTVVASAVADGNSRVFPFPMVETERMITRWLTDSGFRTGVEESGSGEKQVRAQKGTEEWRVVLKPSSPLNTEVSIDCAATVAGGSVRLEAFWAMLDSYAKGARPVTASSRPTPAVQNGAAPRAVLQHQGAVICMENGPGSGHIQLSGFFCEDSGLIMTTAHDLQEHSTLRVITWDGQHFSGRVAKVDHLRDLALIQTGFKPGHAVSPAKGRLTLDPGETVYALGCPQGTLGTVYVGAVNSPPRLANAMPLWQVGMTVLPGSSGSPVFDAQGYLVGVIKGRFRGTDSIGFLIPVSIVLEFLGR